MAFREVRMFEVREVLRLWLRGEGLRAIERLAGIDRKTVRRYVEAAVDTGLERGGGENQLNDVFMSLVVEKVRPHRTDGHGLAWRSLEPHAEKIRSVARRRGPDRGEGPHPPRPPGGRGADPDPGALLCGAVRAKAGPGLDGPGG